MHLFKIIRRIKVKNLIKIFLSILILFVVLLSACATTGRLKTDEIRASDVKGEFSVILYGARYADDLENVAILDIEGDGYKGYKFEVFAPDFDYRIKTGVPAKEAVEMAERFVSFHSSFKRSQVSRIMDSHGNVIGYEFRPLYSPAEFGWFDVLDIDYWLKDGVVTVKIDLIPELKHRKLFDELNDSSNH
jgi:hypothetical protein